MGRHDEDRRHNKSETKEERLLRKAREYVDQHKEDGDRSKKSSKKSRHDDRRHSKRHDRKRERSDRDDSKSRKRHRKHDRSEDEEDRHHHRSRKDDKKKRKKKDSKRSKHDKERSSQKRVDKSKLYPLGAVRGSPPEELLDVDKDYFAYHQKLWVYLYREEGIVFGDLSSDEAHAAFKRFVKKYNAGELEAAYYDAILPSEAVEECKTTNHKWAFNTSETERKSLHFLQEGVRKQTEYESGTAKNSHVPVSQRDGSSNVARLPPTVNERKRLTPQERLAERTANRRLREHVRTAEEEFSGGRADPGRERQIEKRKERAAAIHGASRDREDARIGGVELNDEAIYGGGGDTDFQGALARERQRNAHRQQKKQDRISELKQKEQDKQDAMIKMLGLTGVKPGQKIKIAPRNDT